MGAKRAEGREFWYTEVLQDVSYLRQEVFSFKWKIGKKLILFFPDFRKMQL